ncbi:putative Carbonyl reductase [Vibrio nigripulchritudo SO65]|uniref:SDR family oxidoreductase n=1 Tax=Vibrio nigripulchritudo TaxID=28173 RepID=UPI0003B2193F|nr:SDR family oxidoreductase [Vibrio nigripulchritudo]CCN33106.1 putative Carbonyl reductase [Vibrio nigripulchritudo AM115]CCN41205.1 putative Carbonyl reductase [Vibrio nigripulchritudo FTn2]CCN67977.1 putative Carbonyl reductase [Vibrio nigripulchritudo POn4]CCN78263.1 putative Carbonyl reductase [Vibrio nigripulchritudo SO65]
MSHVVITGANRGIGLALVKQYLALNWTITATYRSEETAQDLIELAETNPQLTAQLLDVTDYNAVSELATQLGTVDMLINNAGYYGPKGYGFGNTDPEEWRKVIEINTIAPLKLVELLYDNLKASDTKTVICVSSKVGSMAENTSGGGYIYRSSKAALNSVVKSLHNDLSAQGFKVAAVHPGWVLTEMGGPNALITTEVSAEGLVKVIASIDEEKSGGFFDYQGNPILW